MPTKVADITGPTQTHRRACMHLWAKLKHDQECNDMENARNLHKSSKGICPALMQNASNSVGGVDVSELWSKKLKSSPRVPGPVPGPRTKDPRRCRNASRNCWGNVSPNWVSLNKQNICCNFLKHFLFLLARQRGKPRG